MMEHLVWTGRMRRRTYVLSNLFAGPIALYFLYSLSVIDDTAFWVEMLMYPVLFLLFWLELMASIKRFHDLDKSGAYILLLLIPIVNLGGAWLLFFKPGTEGPNQFGPDPKNLSE